MHVCTVFPLIEGGSQIRAGSLIQVGGQTSFIPIQAGLLIEAGGLRVNTTELIAHTPVFCFAVIYIKPRILVF